MVEQEDYGNFQVKFELIHNSIHYLIRVVFRSIFFSSLV